MTGRLVKWVPAPRNLYGKGLDPQAVDNVRLAALIDTPVTTDWLSGPWTSFRGPFLEMRRNVAVGLRRLRRARDAR